MREYEIVSDSEDTQAIAITLFRGVGFLGKENLLRRPGRPSGIKLATPDSQLHGEIHFDLGLVFSNHSYTEAAIPESAKQTLTPVITYNQLPFNAMKLNKEELKAPSQYSLWSLDEKNLIVSTIKVAENQAGILARIYNTNDQTVTCDNPIGYTLVSLDEQHAQTVDQLTLTANEVKTLQIKTL